MSDVAVVNIYIKVNGQFVSQTILDNMRSVSVESSLAYPDSAHIIFNDDAVDLIDKSMTTFKPGATLEIQFPNYTNNSETFITVFKGEITSLSPNFEADYTASITVSGYDKSHRLMRGTYTRAFKESYDSDIVKKIAGEAGLTAKVDATTIKHEHIYQDNQTNLDFLQQLAQRNGYHVYVDDGNLNFVKSSDKRSTVTVEWGTSLVSFRPRLSTARQVNEVIVRSWDNATQKKIEGKATSSKTHPQINVGGSGGDVTKKAFSAAKRIEVTHPVISDKHAESVAQAILDKINSEFVEAEGLTEGNPNIVAGIELEVKNIGTAFSGKYIVTTAHHFLENGIYRTEVRVEGSSPYFMGGILDHSSSQNTARQIWSGIYPAIVTNNKDTEKKENRVKLKYPWLDETQESHWARMVLPGAGNQMGSHWLPEVNDEVLVMFEQGDINRPYVIGGAYSAKNKPISGSQDGEPVDKRIWRSRSGHQLTMDDKKGNEYIELITGKGHFLKLDDKAKKIELKTTGGQQLIIDGQGNKIIISGANTIEVDSQNAVNIKAGGNAKIEATGNCEIKATGNATVQGSQVEVKGSAMVKVSAPMVQIG